MSIRTIILILLLVVQLIMLGLNAYFGFLIKREEEKIRSEYERTKKDAFNHINKKKINDNFNEDEYLNSLEFNKKLDGMITQLLGKHSNAEIARMISVRIMKTDMHNLNREKLMEYISNVLLNYTNDYDPMRNMEEYTTHESHEYIDPARDSNLNEVDISDSMRNFYK